MDYRELKLVAFLVLCMEGKSKIWTTQSRIASLAGVSQQSVSRLLRELEKLGYVSRRISRRGELLELTPLGVKALEELHSMIASVVEGSRGVLLLEGVVVSGLGEGRFYLSRREYSEVLEKILGFKPFPGTLNVRLAGESVWKRAALDVGGRFVPGFEDETRTYGGVRVYRARINGYEPAGLVLPERTSHPKSVVELVAPVSLRRVLGLKDGDVVSIEVFLGETSDTESPHIGGKNSGSRTLNTPRLGGT
ncbi:MAG: DUF120 domain-containing protein [Fervidicoccaceae archaeon]